MQNSPMGWGQNNKLPLFAKRRRRLNKRPRTVSRSPSFRRIRYRVPYGTGRLSRFPASEPALAETKVSFSTINIMPKVLGSHDFVWPQETGTSYPSLRRGNNVRACGIKQYGTIKNQAGVYVKVMCALLIAKAAERSDTVNDNFFRDPLSQTDRTMHFADNHPNVEPAPNQNINNVLKYCNYPINPEKYHIAYRASKILGPENDDRGDSSYIWHFRKNVRINRLVQFINGTDTQSMHEWKWVYWVEPVDKDDLAGDNSSNLIDFQIMHTLIFRNVE